jgi:fucose permease
MTELVQSLSNPPMNKYRFVCACLISFVMGLNDSALGALIPYMETMYDVSYGTISFVFVTTAAGFILAAPFTNRMHARLGRSKMLAMALMCSVVGYIMLISTPPFPVVVVAYFPIGLGSAWVLALNNVFVASLVNATTLLGVFHGMYGVGGTVGPLVATALASTGHKWSTFYTITLAISMFNVVFSFFVYRRYEAEIATSIVLALERTASRQNEQRAVVERRSFLRTLITRVTLLGALFIFAYQGAEVSISGWVISFLLTTREHPASQTASLGYVTAGFWAGITLGRFLLSHPAQRIGEKLAVFLMIAGSIGFQFLVWFVPNIIGPAVAVSIVGLLLGPVYPCATSIFSRLLRKDELVPALAVISAMGSSGGAVAPFVTGIISQKVGTWVLNPIAVGLFGMMGVCWFTLPKVAKKSD